MSTAHFLAQSFGSGSLFRMHQEVEAFTNWISPTPIEDEIRELTVSIVSGAISVAFPDAKVMPFGSYETKLYLPSRCAYTLIFYSLAN